MRHTENDTSYYDRTTRKQGANITNKPPPKEPWKHPIIYLNSDSETSNTQHNTSSDETYAPQTSKKKPKKGPHKTQSRNNSAKTGDLDLELEKLYIQTHNDSEPYEPLDIAELEQIYSQCQQNTNYQNVIKDLKCCAVCGMGFPNIKFPDITIERMTIEQVPHFDLLWDTNNNPILHEDGIFEDEINICSMDLDYLQQSSMWKFALANNNYEGL